MISDNRITLETTIEELTNHESMQGWRAVVYEIDKNGTRTIRDIFVKNQKEELLELLETEDLLGSLKG